MTAVPARVAPAGVTNPGFGEALASEWAKLRTQRSITITVAVGIVLGIGLTALTSWAIGATFADWNAAEQADFDPILYSLNGVVVGLIAMTVVGAMAVTPEYSSGMIRLTFTATAKRGRILMAKALIVTMLSVVAGLLLILGSFFVGQWIFGAYDMPTASLGDADTLRFIAGGTLTTPVFPVIAVALGFLLRSTAGAITSGLVLIFAPEIFGGLLPRWWRENVISLLPGPASDSIAMGHIVDSPSYSDPAVGALITAAWLAGFLLLAFVVLQRRDA